MPNLKHWLKNRLERLMLAGPFVRTTILKRGVFSGKRHLQIIIPHRANWRLTASTVHAFQRLTTGDFGITLVVNFDSMPVSWEPLSLENLTIVENQFSSLGKIYRYLFSSENGSMQNALGITKGIEAEPDFDWGFVAHNDSAPLCQGWNEYFFQALGTGLVIGNLRDSSRVFAAHASGTLFHQQEFRQRQGTVWPKFRFGEMVWDVGDGLTQALHTSEKTPVPVLPNSLQNPALKQQLEPANPTLAKFVNNGTHVSFDKEMRFPIFAHLGRGTPRSKQDPFFAHKLPVDQWIEWIDSIL